MMGDKLKLLAEHDQDEAHGLEWFRRHTPDQLMTIWEMIQKTYDDPNMEIIARLAQMGMSRLAMLANGTIQK